jgi:alpha-beta hydrolase superfamily lysophospholipase
MKVLLSDQVFDGQLLRAMGHTYEGGADFGECYSTATRIKPHDTESWYKEWNATAVRIEKIAKTALEKRHRQSAYEAYLRASMYHRASGQFFIGDVDEQRTLPAFQRAASCFEEAMKVSSTLECETIKIPYKDGAYLPAYFITPVTSDVEKTGHTIIVNGGYDSVKEECFFFSGAAALRRGYKILLFDGPGQGLTLLEQKITTIPDWENVMTPIVDYLYTRNDVDKSKIAAIGISFGGYQVPRAVTKEKRISAVIADPAQVSIGKKARARLPLPLGWKTSFPKDMPWLVVSLINTVLGRRAADPSYGWTMRRIKHVHGLASVTAMFEELDKFELDPVEVTCPIYISFAEHDDIAVDAEEFYRKCGSKIKKFVRYTEADGSDEHCEAANRASFNQDALDWLEELWA